MQEKEFERQNVFKKGAENTAYAQFFIGTSYLNPLTSPQNKPFCLPCIALYTAQHALSIKFVDKSTNFYR